MVVQSYNPETLKTIGYHQTYDSLCEDEATLQQGFDRGYEAAVEEGIRLGGLLGVINIRCAIESSSISEGDLETRNNVNTKVRAGLTKLMMNLDPKKEKTKDEQQEEEDDEWLKAGRGNPNSDEDDDDDWLNDDDSDVEDVKSTSIPASAVKEEEVKVAEPSVHEEVLSLIENTPQFKDLVGSLKNFKIS
jgi:hypothetical protein